MPLAEKIKLLRHETHPSDYDVKPTLSRKERGMLRQMVMREMVDDPGRWEETKSKNGNRFLNFTVKDEGIFKPKPWISDWDALDHTSHGPILRRMKSPFGAKVGRRGRYATRTIGVSFPMGAKVKYSSKKKPGEGGKRVKRTMDIPPRKRWTKQKAKKWLAGHSDMNIFYFYQKSRFILLYASILLIYIRFYL